MQREPTATTQPVRRRRDLNHWVRGSATEREEESLKAYVLIQTEANREPIAATLRQMPGVISAENVTGPYDAIALAGSDSTRTLTEHVVTRIQQLPGVIRALSTPLIGSLGQMRATELRGRVEAA